VPSVTIYLNRKTLLDDKYKHAESLSHEILPSIVRLHTDDTELSIEVIVVDEGVDCTTGCIVCSGVESSFNTPSEMTEVDPDESIVTTSLAISVDVSVDTSWMYVELLISDPLVTWLLLRWIIVPAHTGAKLLERDTREEYGGSTGVDIVKRIIGSVNYTQ